MDNQKWALVTGASSGMGAAYAEELAKQGFAVILVGNREEETENKANFLNAHYHIPTKTLIIDLAQQEAAKQVFEYCQKWNLQVEVLINNAGTFFWHSLTAVEDSKIQNMLQLHVTTPTMLCYYFGQQMQKRKHGYILNVASIVAWMPFPTLAMYANTKTYLKNFSYSLHYELKQYGVCLSYVAPGAVDTNLYGLPQKTRKKLLHLHIMHTPQYVAKKALKGLFKGKKRIVPGAINYLVIALVKICPLCLVDSIRKRFFKQL